MSAVVVALFATPWTRSADVEPRKLEVPRYLALIEWDVPTGPVKMTLHVALEPVSGTPAAPPQVLIGVAPSKNSTSPPGLSAGVEATVAVKVTVWPMSEGLAEELRL